MGTGQKRAGPLDVLEHERKHFVEADRHNAAAKEQVNQQKRAIEKLVQGGHDTRIAMSLLDAMERGLEALKHHREIVVEMIETLQAVTKTKSLARGRRKP